MHITTALLLPLATAVTARLQLVPRADPTAPWVSVDEDGQPQTTYTPTTTLVDGTPSVIDGAPHDLTASLYTFTKQGYVITSTGSPSPPTATAESGAGAFPRCFNETGLVCEPPEGSELHPGKTYYVTWDPDSDLFAGMGKNATYEISIHGDYVNATDGNVTQAFDASEAVPVTWGFYPWTVSSSLLSAADGHANGANITLTFRVGRTGSREKTTLMQNARSVTVQRAPAFKAPDRKKTDAKTLMIALPTVLGFVLIVTIGAFVFMRHHRRIDVSELTRKSRRGGLGAMSASRRARRERLAKVDAASSIPLTGDMMGGRERYHDDDDEWEVHGYSDRQPGGGNGNGNGFRDEVARQDHGKRS